MKRNVLLKHLKENSCTLKREGANHSWYVNTINGNLTSVPAKYYFEVPAPNPKD